MAQQVKNLPAVQGTQEMQLQSLGQEEPLGEENGNPLQYSCLKNPMNRGVWQALVQRVALLDTTERLHTHVKKKKFRSNIQFKHHGKL